MSEMHTVVITIVGTVSGGEQFRRDLEDLLCVINDTVDARMPGFVRAAQPIIVVDTERFAAPEQWHYSPRVAAVEHDVIQAARQWHAKRRGAAAALRRAVEAYVRFPG